MVQRVKCETISKIGDKDFFLFIRVLINVFSNRYRFRGVTDAFQFINLLKAVRIFGKILLSKPRNFQDL